MDGCQFGRWRLKMRLSTTMKITVKDDKQHVFFFSILMFEEKKKEKQKPKGVAPKRDLSSLP